MRASMNKKKNTAPQGRHAIGPSTADSSKKASDQGSGTAPSSSSARGQAARSGLAGKPAPSRVPDATIAMPPAKRGTKPPKSTVAASKQSAPSPGVRPVDASKASKRSRKNKPLKVVGITLGVILGLLVAVYAGIAVYFTDRFMPNSNVGDIDVSLMSAADAEKALVEAIDDYTLSIGGDGFSLTLSSSDAALSIDEASVIRDMLDDTNPWLWPLEVRNDHDETDKLVAVSNGTGLENAIRSAVEEFNASAEQPVNATIAYDPDQGAFAVQPESAGTALDANQIVRKADEALAVLNPKVTLTAEDLLKPTVLSTDAALATATANANTMIAAELVLTMAGDTAATLDAGLISQWVVLGEDLSATLDDGALTAWVEQLASDCNTVGTQRSYTRPDGKSITVSGGAYGWTVDSEALLATVKDAVANGTQATVEIPCSTSGKAYNGAGGQDWGARYCDIDLSEQYVRFYDESGALVWESPCVSGLPNGKRDTPTGVYWLNQKASPSTLIGYENGKKTYETPVQYWMPFVGNSVGLHDANWQSSFGGTRYKTNGSHGCVNLPPSAAGELYGIIQAGDVVVCHW